ncbi:MAG: hypothetical protein MZV64_72625 [Ignavibacteriales bacterium]|nr:hypothetical protein [Ignavibacteriales bacterium]
MARAARSWGSAVTSAARTRPSRISSARARRIADDAAPGYKVGQHRIQGISDEFIPAHA